MRRDVLRNRAETLRRLHGGPGILLLPNIWDPLGARMLASLGYPAVATASAAVAWSAGHRDGQRIPLERVLDTISRIAEAVDVPLTADLEAGYADDPEHLAENVRKALEAGAVGVNIEDSHDEGGRFFGTAEQAARIRAVRAMADREDVPIVINARTDVFLTRRGSSAERLDEAIARGRAYREAGADCFYPIGADDPPILDALVREVGLPLNVLARGGTPPVAELKQLGVKRLSLGPGLIRASLTAMLDVARTLLEHGSYDRFTTGAISSSDVEGMLERGDP